MRTDLNDIRVFVTIARCGTLSAAARELGIPASTVSRSLTRLERNTNALLVQRSSRGFQLTDAGQEYAATCRRALRSLQEGRDNLERHRTSPGGLLRIACPVTLAREFLAPVLSIFVDAHPQLRVAIETYSADWDQEPREDVDIFFKVRNPRDSSRRVRSLIATARGIFAAASYLEKHGEPTSPLDLPGHRCIGSGTWSLTQGSKTLTPQIAFHIETSDPGTHLGLIASGVGIGLLPLWAVSTTGKNSLVRVLPKWIPAPITVCALYHGSTKATPKVGVFLEFLNRYFGTNEDPRLKGRRLDELFIRQRSQN